MEEKSNKNSNEISNILFKSKAKTFFIEIIDFIFYGGTILFEKPYFCRSDKNDYTKIKNSLKNAFSSSKLKVSNIYKTKINKERE